MNTKNIQRIMLTIGLCFLLAGLSPLQRSSLARGNEIDFRAIDEYKTNQMLASRIPGLTLSTLTFAVSRALGRLLSPGDEIVVTHLDHDANITPWTLLARDTGAVVRWVDIRPEDCTLDMASFAAQISRRTKIVAAGYASNAVGTINDVKTIVEMAHTAGALTYVDAVQYAPHGPVDVKALGCDFLVCSAYKFFGPHVGVLYGKLDLLERLSA